MRFFVAFFLFFTSSISGAQVLQILHSNDIHSFWERSFDRELGGMARMKSLMDRLESEGNSKGWVTIRLDSGDFSDGNLNYFAGRGMYSFQLMKLMGYDVIALGNHDFVTGVEPLVWHASKPEEALPLVAANFESDRHTNVEPGRIIYRGGLKIAVGGVTTDETLYKWLALPAKITDPQEALDQWMSEQHADIRIALTHVGLYPDEEIVRRTGNIDVVVGGHSHHTLQTPHFVLNKDNKIVPVVQAGYHGRYVGQMVIQLPVGGTAQVIKYKLHPVTSDLPEDPVVKEKIDEGVRNLKARFGQNIDNPIAESQDIFYSSRSQNSALGNLIADTMLEASGADVSFDFSNLYGVGLPKGNLTIEDIFNLQPHTYDINGPGWQIYVANVTGAALKKVVSIASWSGYPFFVGGLVAELSKFRHIKKMTIKGIPVDEKRTYKVATSEGAISGVSHIPLLKQQLPPPYISTGILIRDALLSKVVALKVLKKSSLHGLRVRWPGSEKPLNNAMCGECNDGPPE